MRPIIRPGKVLAIAVVAGSLSGCSALGPSSDEANAVVAAFVQALQAGDGIQACALLNSAAADGVESRTGSDCDRGILSLGLPATMSEPKSTEVYGRSALVQSSEESISSP